MTHLTLYGRPGWGSALIEAQLVHYGLPFDFIEVGDLFASQDARRALARINPLSQIPALVCDGLVMTESAAITLFLADIVGRSDLVPSGEAAERGPFLRWLVFLVANIYPAFTYGDDPSRFVAIEAAREAYKQAVDDRQKAMWRHVEDAAGAPWFLSERRSALDLFIGVMTRWRPGRGWFADHAPKLTAIAKRADAMPALDDVWRRNFSVG